MKNTILLSLLSTIAFSPMTLAGGMGDVSTSCCKPFLSLEGGYSWNSIDGFDLSLQGANASLTSSESTNGATGRVAAGMANMMSDSWGFTSELGWGYYGRTESNGVTNVPLSSLSLSHDISGFDALVGVVFAQPRYSLSLKAGGMIQNLRSKVSAEIAPLGLPVLDSLIIKTNTTQVLPEIKLGGAYNLNHNWALTAGYLLAWGDSPKTTGSFNINTLRANYYVNSQNPTVNSVLLGVQYSV